MSFVDDPDIKLLLALLLAVILAVAAWFYWDDIFVPAEEPVVVLPQSAEDEATPP